MKYPRAETPVVDELIGNLRETARGTADETIARAADVIRKGDFGAWEAVLPVLIGEFLKMRSSEARLAIHFAGMLALACGFAHAQQVQTTPAAAGEIAEALISGQTSISPSIAALVKKGPARSGL